MSEPTADEIARWAALAEGATPGPWMVDPDADVGYDIAAAGAGFIAYDDRRGAINEQADAEFIAAARTAVPRLLALVAAQAEQIAELRGEVERLQLPEAIVGAAQQFAIGGPFSLAETTNALQGVVGLIDRAETAEAELAEAQTTARDTFAELKHITGERDVWIKRAAATEAELAAIHATDDYQRWARAVAERDAAREAAAALNADVALAWGMSCARVDDIQAATRLLGAIRETLGRAYSLDPEPPR